jgi:hypothetical protein
MAELEPGWYQPREPTIQFQRWGQRKCDQNDVFSGATKSGASPRDNSFVQSIDAVVFHWNN